MKKACLIVSERVQDVRFHYSTYALALGLRDIYSRVWNSNDGTVEILAQSEDSARIARFTQKIRKSPSQWSKVIHADIKIANFEDFTDFRIAN